MRRREWLYTVAAWVIGLAILLLTGLIERSGPPPCRPSAARAAAELAVRARWPEGLEREIALVAVRQRIPMYEPSPCRMEAR
jgi:hypothetical protein